jgi:hypothetical protein
VITCVADQDTPFLTELLPVKDRQVRDRIRCFSRASKRRVHRNRREGHEGRGLRLTTEVEWAR